MTDRAPVVAGQFYPASPDELKGVVQKYLKSDAKPKKAIAAIAPHAGYACSGAVAGAVFARVEVPKKVIVLAPNHSGTGPEASIMIEGNWLLPTGTVPVDQDLAGKVFSSSKFLKIDATAHQSEHSLEVMLPFLIERQPELSMVPICLSHSSFNRLEDIGNGIAKVIKKCSDDVLIVVSTDMNHYQDEQMTREKDDMAIRQVQKLNAESLLKTCAREQITMCGVVPTAIAIVAANKLGAKNVELIAHTTSADATGDKSSVVGYAGFIIS